MIFNYAVIGVKSIENQLIAEAERKDTAFRANFDAEQRREILPFTSWVVWNEHRKEIDQLIEKISLKRISADDGHDKVKQLMEAYYNSSYPIT